jgi:hypothetical protein
MPGQGVLEELLLCSYVWDAAVLEGNPFTDPEVQTLLEGITVGGIDATRVPAAREQEFNTEMIDFYWQKDGTRMFQFLASCWTDAQ